MDMKVGDSFSNENLDTRIPNNAVVKVISPKELEKCGAEETVKTLDKLYRYSSVT